MATYSLQDVLSVLDRLAPAATQAVAAQGEVKGRKEHADEVRGAARNITAQAVAIAVLVGLGPKVMRALVADRIPKTPRKAVNLSECFKVLSRHPEAGRLAREWAEGTFNTSVADALKAVKGAPDVNKALTRAVHKAMAAGLDGAQVLAVVDGAILTYKPDEPTATVRDDRPPAEAFDEVQVSSN